MQLQHSGALICRFKSEGGLVGHESWGRAKRKTKELIIHADPEGYALHAEAVVGPVTLVQCSGDAPVRVVATGSAKS